LRASLNFTKTEMRILIVDDNTTTADVVRFNLERNNIGVAVAHDGNQAWRFFQEEEFGCVIVDHTLPGMNGHELCKKIRSVNPHVPLILLTGRTLEPSVMEPYERLNIVKAIPKPFSPRAIVAVVQECIRPDDGTDQDSA
jgi:DNA-binding response OmpR family regulator